MKKRTAYIDSDTFHHELGEAVGGSRLYCSLKDLLKNEICATDCGVYKVSVHFEELALKGNFPPADYDSPMDFPEMCQRLVHSYETRIESYQKRITELKEKLKAIEQNPGIKSF